MTRLASSRPFIIAVDFDGTLVTHEYPEIGVEVPEAIRWLKACELYGVRLILWTIRDGEALEQAVAWCRAHGLELWGVNENPDQASWTKSPKVYASVYIDDAAFGVPMTYRANGKRPFVNWREVGPHLVRMIEGARANS